MNAKINSPLKQMMRAKKCLSIVVASMKCACVAFKGINYESMKRYGIINTICMHIPVIKI